MVNEHTLYDFNLSKCISLWPSLWSILETVLCAFENSQVSIAVVLPEAFNTSWVKVDIFLATIKGLTVSCLTGELYTSGKFKPSRNCCEALSKQNMPLP